MTGTDTTQNGLPERVGRLETSVTNLHSELGDLKTSVSVGFRDLQSSLSAQKQVNWPVIFGIISIAGALYAAAIQPLKADVDRAHRAGETLARAVVIKEEKLAQLQSDLSRLETRVIHIAESLTALKEFGSPVLDRRLAIVEYRLGGVKPISPTP